MAPRAEISQLKRGRPPSTENDADAKKPRRSQRISSQPNPANPTKSKQYLPSPLTHQESSGTERYKKEVTATPPEGRPSQIRHRALISPPYQGTGQVSSPPSDTQAFSQYVHPAQSFSHEVENEQGEGVWGYLIPLDNKFGATLVLKKRSHCSPTTAAFDAGRGARKRVRARKQDTPSDSKQNAAGYLIGRHPECDYVLEIPTISNRHCLIFAEHKNGNSIAILEDLSCNGTFVNEAIVGRNNRRELQEADEITVLDQARFVFRYPKSKKTSAFHQQYTLLEKLGKGHFATVHLCIEKATGQRFAVKIFTKLKGAEDKSKIHGLQQEIQVLMGVDNPSLLCLKDTFDEDDGVYLVLELAPEGELFNLIILKQKLTENETRKIFIQLLQGVKYLHERNIVHRDIKPENILLVDKELTVKLADFGLAKIIGEESFTTTLCGTPSYVAPEILENAQRRKYSRAVDVWSLGVVLYICLCGFPPFSEELCTKENPYSLSQQIKMGIFDYPSPYWDSIGDIALDLIDKMLTVNINDRITVDECLQHRWITQAIPSLTDSTDGLTGAMGMLDFTKRKIHRERTLLADFNDIKVSKLIVDVGADKLPIKVFQKNATGSQKTNMKIYKKEDTPAAHRDPKEFMELGGKGDQSLYTDDEESR
ncbi:MAG: hypothetical protein M1829_006428 [Trizodia sp. TS-e1964]|nr:MAG: hypothetical protein M1829_006428 [Trizodia sp. TS-e1964]